MRCDVVFGKRSKTKGISFRKSVLASDLKCNSWYKTARPNVSVGVEWNFDAGRIDTKFLARTPTRALVSLA